jgi:hypothetical protein
MVFQLLQWEVGFIRQRILQTWAQDSNVAYPKRMTNVHILHIQMMETYINNYIPDIPCKLWTSLYLTGCLTSSSFEWRACFKGISNSLSVGGFIADVIFL